MDPKSIGHTTWVYQTSKSDENKKTKKVVKAFFGLIVFLLLILAANISFENISDFYESEAISIKMEKTNLELKSLENFALLAEIDAKNQIGSRNDETEISSERVKRIKRQDLQLDRTVYYKVRKHKRKPLINKYKNNKRIHHHLKNKHTKSKKNKEIKKNKSKKSKKLHQKQYKKLKKHEIESKNEYSYERPKKYYHYSNPYYKVFNKENYYKPEENTKTTFNQTILPRPYNIPISTTAIKKKTSKKTTHVGTSTTKSKILVTTKIKIKPKPKYTTQRIKTRKTSTKSTTVSQTPRKITTSRPKTTTTTKHATKPTHTTKKKTTTTIESRTSRNHKKYKDKSTEENYHPIMLKLSALNQLREILSEHINKITENETTSNDSSFSKITNTTTLPSSTIAIQTTVLTTTTRSSTTTTNPPIHVYVDLFT